MKKNLFSLFVSLAAVLMILSMADVSSAQRQRESRGRELSKAQVKKIIDRVENSVDNFTKNYDKSLDKSRLNGTKREDNLNQKAKDLESATDELSREFDRRDRWADNKDEVRKCLDIASELNRNINNRRYGAKTEKLWAQVRFDLNTLADVYNLPNVGGGSNR